MRFNQIINLLSVRECNSVSGHGEPCPYFIVFRERKSNKFP